MSRVRRLWWQILVGAVLLLGSLWMGAFKTWEPFHTYLYIFCWVPFLWIVDRAHALKTGEGCLKKSGGKKPLKYLTWLLCLSTSTWLLFEALNFRLGNWFYRGVPEELWIRWPGYAVFYATVLPGIFFLALFIGSLLFNGFDRLESPAGRIIGKGWSLPLGILMFLLPMWKPNIFFPLVWGCFFFIFEPFVQKFKGSSLLQDWVHRRYQRTVSLLLSGFLCGVFWEACNFGAGAKWVYNIPYVGFLKVFEMPVFGFLGFPVFALEVYVITQFVHLLWKKLGPGWRRSVVFLMVCFWILVFSGIDRFTVHSYIGGEI